MNPTPSSFDCSTNELPAVEMELTNFAFDLELFGMLVCCVRESMRGRGSLGYKNGASHATHNASPMHSLSYIEPRLYRNHYRRCVCNGVRAILLVRLFSSLLFLLTKTI